MYKDTVSDTGILIQKSLKTGREYKYHYLLSFFRHAATDICYLPLLEIAH